MDSVGQRLFWLRPIVKAGAIAGLTSVVLVMMLAQSRILYAMAKDGLLPHSFGKVHHRFRTPYVATLLTGVIATAVSALFPIGILGELVSIGTLLAFFLVDLGIIFLRRKNPAAERPFRTPFVPFVPILGALFALLQMVSLPANTWYRLFAWMALGLIIYVVYGRRRQVLLRPRRLEGHS